MADCGIVIGIDRYPGLSDLKGPGNDAKRFYDWLVDPTKGGLAEANVSRLSSADFPPPKSIREAHPVLSEIHALFSPFVTIAANHEHIDGRLFIFVAGHGFADPQDMSSAALFSAEASLSFYAHLAVQKFAQFFRRHWAFDEIVLIVDACRTTVPTQRIANPPLPELEAHANAGKVKLFQAYASGFGQAARERPIAGAVRGIFTEAVLDALDNAVPNRLGRVTGTIVKRHVHNVIERIAGRVMDSQPVVEVDENRDVLFIARPVPAQDAGDDTQGIETRFATQEHHRGQTLVITTGQNLEVRRTAIAESPLTLRLLPGIYRVQVVETGQSMLFEVPGNAIVSL